MDEKRTENRTTGSHSPEPAGPRRRSRGGFVSSGVTAVPSVGRTDRPLPGIQGTPHRYTVQFGGCHSTGETAAYLQVEGPRGQTAGPPHNRPEQTGRVLAALRLLEIADTPGQLTEMAKG